MITSEEELDSLNVKDLFSFKTFKEMHDKIDSLENNSELRNNKGDTEIN